VDLFAAAGVRVEIRTAVLPPIVLGGEGGGGGGAGVQGSASPAAKGSKFDPLALLQPDVRITTSAGAELYHYQPKGEPPGFPWVGVAALVIVVGGLVGAGFALGRWTG